MDNKYISLFLELIRATSTTTEQVIKFNQRLNDEKGAQTAKIMYEDYKRLENKLKEENCILQKNDYTKLFAGALIIAKNIENKIKTYQTALQGYESDLIPKLQRILEETKTDEEAQILADELFNSLEKK